MFDAIANCIARLYTPSVDPRPPVDHIIASHGDTWITLVDTPSNITYRYRVSRRVLCMASLVFRVMMRGPWTESQPDEHGQYQINTSGFDPEALHIVLDRIHMGEPDEPNSGVDPDDDENSRPAQAYIPGEIVGWDVRFDYGRYELFSKMVDVIDYYQMFEARAIGHGVREWLFHSGHLKYTPDDLAMMLRFAYRIKHADALEDVVKMCIEKLSGPMEQELPTAIARLGKPHPVSFPAKTVSLTCLYAAFEIEIWRIEIVDQYGEILPGLVGDSLFLMSSTLPCKCVHPWTRPQFTAVDLRRAGYDHEGRVISTTRISTIHEIVEKADYYLKRGLYYACVDCMTSLAPMRATMDRFREVRGECFDSCNLPDVSVYLQPRPEDVSQDMDE